MTTMKPSQPEVTRRYLARQKERGMRRLTVQVPVDRVEEVKAYCAKLREAARRE